MTKKQISILLVVINILLLSNTNLTACMAGVEFLIKVNPALVDRNFYNQFSVFSQKIDDMAYFILKRNSTLALEKYNFAYSALFNIYQKYFNSPPPIFKDKATFQHKLDYFTKKLSSFKELIKNEMFASASENLKQYVKEINSFINPSYKWNKKSQKIIPQITLSAEKDAFLTLDSIVKSFAYSGGIQPQKIKLGKINFSEEDIAITPIFKKTIQENNTSFTFETKHFDFTDVLTDSQLQNHLSQSYKYIVFGEILSPEVVSQVLINSEKTVEKKIKLEKAILRYKFIDLENLSLVKIDEKEVGLKTEEIINLKTGGKTTVLTSLGNPHRIIKNSFMQTGQQCAIDKKNKH